MLEGKGAEKRLEYYFSNLAIIWLAVAFYRTNKYYVDFLKPETQAFLFFLALAYTVAGFFIYVLRPSKGSAKASTGATLIDTVSRLFAEAWAYIHNFTGNPSYPVPKISKYEQTVILFALVKIFFLPIMLNFLVGNYYDASRFFGEWQSQGFALSIDAFNKLLYPLLLAFLVMVDTAIFTIGYSVESDLLGNKVRSVEPTFLGWTVALVCYPPFASFLGVYAYWYASDNFTFASAGLTFAALLVSLALFSIYLWASIALGAKASNLTNRGIVASGPYAHVRHPAYVAKNLAWWVSILPLLSIENPVLALGIIISTAFWSFIYFLRAITEERHLISDPDYVAYCKKVKYRFIPGVY